MKTALAWAGIIVVAVLGALGLNMIGLGFNRVAAPYAEETRARTYESSRAYNQGMAIDLDDLCRQWRTSTDPNQRAALADTIRLRAARYDITKLPPQVRGCVEEIR